MSATVAAAGDALKRDASRLRDALGLSYREARSEVELLMRRALNITRARLIANPELAAAALGHETYLLALQRRLGGEPIAYILGEREFYGLVFSVCPDVLIPRPETELLVDMALARLDANRLYRVLDLGTGSGAIAVAIARQRPHVELTAVDLSLPALAVTRLNCERLLPLESKVNVVHGDWFEALRGVRFDLIVANPPYVAAGDEHLGKGDIRFEPQDALIAGHDGLDALQRIIGEAPRHLCAGGWLLCEHGHDQAGACQHLLQRAGFAELVAQRDLAGIVRVSGGRRLTADTGSG